MTNSEQSWAAGANIFTTALQEIPEGVRIDAFRPLPQILGVSDGPSAFLAAEYGPILNAIFAFFSSPTLIKGLFRPQLGPEEGLKDSDPTAWGTFLKVAYLIDNTATRLRNTWLQDADFTSSEAFQSQIGIPTETLTLGFKLSQGLAEPLFRNFLEQQIDQDKAHLQLDFDTRLKSAINFIDDYARDFQTAPPKTWLPTEIDKFPDLLILLKAAFDPQNSNGWKELVKFQAENDLPITVIVNGDSTFKLNRGDSEFAELRIGFRNKTTEDLQKKASPLRATAQKILNRLNQEKAKHGLPEIRHTIMLHFLGFMISFCEGEALKNLIVVNTNSYLSSVRDKKKTLRELCFLGETDIEETEEFMLSYLHAHELAHEISDYLLYIINRHREKQGLKTLKSEGKLGVLDELAGETLGIKIILEYLEYQEQLTEEKCTFLLNAIFSEAVGVFETQSSDRDVSGANYYYSEKAIIEYLIGQGFLEIETSSQGRKQTKFNRPVEAIKSITTIWENLWSMVYDPSLELVAIEDNSQSLLDDTFKDYSSETFLELLTMCELPETRRTNFNIY